jgi:NADH-quinone oxidoreductase subunit N
LITKLDFTNSVSFIVVASAALLIMILEIIFPKSQKKMSETVIFYFSLITLIIAFYFNFQDLGKNNLIFSNYLRINQMTVMLNLTLIMGIFITVLSSKDYLEAEGINYGEYYSLLFFALLGMMILVCAYDLITIFIGLELMSLCFYILTGFMRKKLESNESALKYFLLGAFVTGFLLLGIAFIYGSVLSTNLMPAANFKAGTNVYFMIGLTLVFIAFIFKTGSFPLQMWIPDVYQGSPTIIAGMMSAVGKTAAFGALLTFFSAYEIKNIPVLVSVIAILTMLYGNVLALKQTNIKRLLAYSSIAHAGYIMMGFIQINNSSEQAVVFYLISYILMQLGAFVIAGEVEEKTLKAADVQLVNDLETYKGLGRTNPGLAVLLSVFLFSLAGIPPFAGFWGKYYIFLSAIQNNFIWVAIIGILLSLVGVYYYIKIILYMWFYEPVHGETRVAKKNFAFSAAVIATLGIFAFGLYPDLIFRYLKIIF